MYFHDTAFVSQYESTMYVPHCVLCTLHLVYGFFLLFVLHFVTPFKSWKWYVDFTLSFFTRLLLYFSVYCNNSDVIMTHFSAEVYSMEQ